MSVKKEESGRRSIQVELEVPGTPEEVWETIATGPGVSSWFVPTKFEMGDNGIPKHVTSHFGKGMDAFATLKEWEPPHRFLATSEDYGPDGPTIATEWIVEAQSGGTCVVRIVHSLFAASDEWDNQLESHKKGWQWFFYVLRLYLSRFKGESSKVFRLMGRSADSQENTWLKLKTTFGIDGVAEGGRFTASGEVPALAGTLEKIDNSGAPLGAVLVLDEPASGIADIFSHEMGGQIYIVMDLHYYGEAGQEAFKRDEPKWQEWMNTNYPFPAESDTEKK
jgi:hypothetical protein